MISHLLIILISFYSSAAIGSETNRCFLEKYAEYSKAKKQWQIDSTNIIYKYKPKLSKVANIYKNDQLILIEKNMLYVTSLLTSKQEDLKTHKKLSQWVDISKDKEQELANRSKRFSELLLQAEVAKNRDPHPDGGKLRPSMRTEVMQLPEFQKLLSSFNKRIMAIDSRVCNAT